ncbi:MAG: hypothetical protein A3K19_05025 [Lentisphaerae bacterium RIFOXYB12_FULL_65_16]|nr:MAG: hypothetical protein A3K19_05025 [Lentisphaerae bacterium RIFOXYB12_FULL_65_16]
MQFSASMYGLPVRRTASTMRLQSSTVEAAVTSLSTAQPASSATTVWSAWTGMGVPTNTMSRPLCTNFA